MLRIPSESGIMEISCSCKRPEIVLGEFKDNPKCGEWFIGNNWLPMGVFIHGVTKEQDDYITELNEKFNEMHGKCGRLGYGGPIKKDLEVIISEETSNFPCIL